MDTTKWLEVHSTDGDSQRIRRHLDRLIATMIRTAADRQGHDDVLRILRAQDDVNSTESPSPTIAPPASCASGRVDPAGLARAVTSAASGSPPLTNADHDP